MAHVPNVCNWVEQRPQSILIGHSAFKERTLAGLGASSNTFVLQLGHSADCRFIGSAARPRRRNL